MSLQLILIDDTEREWRIDDHTKEVGLRGIAEARAALGRRPAGHPDPTTHQHSAAA